jgi:thiosulfate/3-mercaptopyruvate sulfurtransferase
MSVEFDANEEFAQYANPGVMVSGDWLQQNLGSEGLVVLESNEDILLYETGHIPGAIKVDWHTELNDQVVRDYLSPKDFAALMSAKGINREDTVVIYGDKSNWWATYALWVFKLFGHEDVRILNGGRDLWLAENRPTTTEKPTVVATEYPLVDRDDESIRAFRDDVVAHFGNPLIDVRSPEEYSGERTHMPSYPDEGALRGGHIPSAASVPWSKAANADGTFRTRAELDQLYRVDAGINDSSDVIAYCRIGERSSHTWFVLKYLLGIPKVRNYDGSWTEWGSLVRAAIVKGTEPGLVPHTN